MLTLMKMHHLTALIDEKSRMYFIFGKQMTMAKLWYRVRNCRILLFNCDSYEYWRAAHRSRKLNGRIQLLYRRWWLQAWEGICFIKCCGRPKVYFLWMTGLLKECCSVSRARILLWVNFMQWAKQLQLHAPSVLKRQCGRAHQGAWWCLEVNSSSFA